MTAAAYIIGALARFAFAVIRLAVTVALREPMAMFIALVILAVLVLFWKVALTRHGKGWRRVRSIRFRLWLRLRPGRGFASLPELWLHWGRLSALSYGARSRPCLSLPGRLTRRTSEFAAFLGRAQYRRRLYVAFELHRLVLAPPRTDKALALDTPVPTPSGWTTMGALRVGDVIFGLDGRPTTVLGAHPVRYNRPCYEIEFSDGTVVTADEHHLWLVNTRASRMSESGQKKYRHDTPAHSQQLKRQMPQVLTTGIMAKSVRVGSDHRANYSVDVAAPLVLPKASLPVPPYTLGAWLGDGHSRGGEITTMDPEVVAAIEAEGLVCKLNTWPSAQRRCPTYRIMGIQGRLRELGVLKNKHIPLMYLRASEAQRRALLAGLLDSDGCCERTGISFKVTNERLARDVRHLAASLGCKATLSAVPAKFRGKDCGTTWTVWISCEKGVLFRLSRKAARQAQLGTGRAGVRKRQRYIVDIRPVPSVPVRCITVDSPDSLYLVTEACIPTHNTGMLADWIIRHPGPALTTSTRADLHQLTSPSRCGRGPVYVFNPEGVGDVPSTFAWDLLGVCTDELMAHKMADWLAGDTPGYGDLSWFEEQGTMGMSGLLLAAAKTGATLAEVYQWVQRRGHERALAALAGHGNPQLHAVVRSLMEDNRTAASVRSTIARALKWAVIPQLAAAVGRNGRFNAREFALRGGALHLIASGDSRSVITPLLRALASYVHFEAGLAGSRAAAGKLDPPLLMAMDEVAQVCLAAGTLVLTREGYIPIEAVSVGDRVLTHAGRWRRVLAKTCNGTRPVVRVRAQGVADLRATPDHQLWMRRGSGKHAKEQALSTSPVWAPAASTLGSYVNLPLPPVEDNLLSEEDWWIIGRWLGDGHRSMGQHGDIGFLISCSHQELPGLLARLGSRAGYVRRLRTTSVVRLRGDEDGWLKAVLRGCGSGAAGKKVPAIALALCPEKAEALLSGYLSADGYYSASEDAWRASSTSRALLLGMAMVAQRARGAVASVYAGRPARKHVIEGRVVQAKQEWTLCFSSGSRPPRPQGGNSRSGWIDISGGAWKKVRAIQDVDAAEVWDLRVEGDESFVAEGCAVHNCPVDLPSMLADSAGKGIVFVTVGHSLAKLEERYGKEGAANIWAISGVKMLLRGITEPQTLEDVSRVCGTLGDDDDDKARIVPPEVLRRLPAHHALVINMDLAPTIVRVSRAWKRRSVRRLASRVPALPGPREIPAEDLAGWPVPQPSPEPVSSANGHGGKPGPLAKGRHR